MLNLFQIASNDQSIYYLTQIFGYVGDVLPVQTGSANLIFGVMFKIFNTIALTVGAFILTYATVVGLMQTAHEGEFLGKKWAKLWVPIRMVIGTAAVFPAASGYSMIQVLVMWIVIQGVGAADTLWTAVLNYINTTGSPFSSVSPDTSSVNSQMTSLFQGLVCQASVRAKNPPAGSDPYTISWYCGNSSYSGSDFCQQSDQELYNVIDGKYQVTTLSGGIIQYNFGPNPTGGISCGYFEYTDPKTSTDCQADPNDANNTSVGPNSLACLSDTAQQQSLQNIVPVLAAVANQYVLTDYQYAYFYETPVVPPNQPPNTSQSPKFLNADGTTSDIPDWIQNYCQGANLSPCCVNPHSTCTAWSQFAADVESNGPNNYDKTNTSSSAASVYSTYSMVPYLGPNQDFIDAATNEFIQEGITGPFTTYITTLSASDLSSAYATMANNGWLTAGNYYYYLMKQGTGSVQAAQSTLIVTVNASSTTFGSIVYRSNASSTTYLLNAIAKTVTASGLGSISNVASNAVTGRAGGIISKFISDMSSKSSLQPMVSISVGGFQMMAAAQGIFLSIPVIIATLLAAGTISPFVLGNGISENPWGEALKGLLTFFTPFLIMLLSSLFTIGALLGIYMPLVPFFLYTFAVIGWFIGTIEAMVAAPLIALGILSPGGQHEIFGRAEPSVMILFNLCLRPSLLVFGLVAAMILSSQVIRIFNIGLALISIDILNSNGLLEQIIFMGIYTSSIVTVVSKVFSLIHVIPERAISYIGGHGTQYGESEALSGAKSGAEAAAGGMARGGKSAGGAAVKGAAATQKAGDKREESKQAKSKASVKAEPEGEGKKGKEGN